MSMLSVLCVMLAFILFLLGASSRWWGVPPQPNPRPYYPAFLSAGLAFLVLGVWLLPLMK
jgi:hypothetical protein